MRDGGLFRNPWWIVVGSFFGLMVANITIYQFAFSVLNKPISVEFGWNRTMASSAVLSASFFSAIATPVVG
ncbi:hypothetical protein [uncultured Caballeronia sp.]|uniref:hypothetical protein n=1 Tax=uncultured Caballeronia sp. TaxID=1827198 RepID=UPI0035CB85A8